MKWVSGFTPNRATPAFRSLLFSKSVFIRALQETIPGWPPEHGQLFGFYSIKKWQILKRKVRNRLTHAQDKKP